MLATTLSSLVFPLLSENVKVKMHMIISLPVVLYGYKTWHLTLKGRTYRGCVRTGCWGEHMDLRRKLEKTSEWRS